MVVPNKSGTCGWLGACEMLHCFGQISLQINRSSHTSLYVYIHFNHAHTTQRVHDIFTTSIFRLGFASITHFTNFITLQSFNPFALVC
jgi:hypothetical protein